MARYRSTVVLALFVAAAAATVVTAAKGPHTLYEAALAEPEAAKVVEKIESSGLITQFQKPNLKVTVFVPSNAAFERITKAIAYNDKLLNDPFLMRQMLAYHVVNRSLKAKDFDTGVTVEPTVLGGQPIKITKTADGKLRVAGYDVIKTDIIGGKSVMHVIDGVLVAPTLLPQLVAQLQAGKTA